MGKKRRKHSDEFKAKVALEAVKGVHTLSELSSKYGVHTTVIAEWKRRLVDQAAEVSSTRTSLQMTSLDDEQRKKLIPPPLTFSRNAL